jgi:hypothetical protein
MLRQAIELDRFGRRLDPRPICYSEPLRITGRMTRVRGMAHDAAGGLDPNSGALPAPQMRPDRAQAIGARKESMDQSEPQALSKQHASALHDLAVAAGANEADLDSFARVLALLSTGGEHGAATQDRSASGGSGKITRDQASRAWALVKDKLNPEDLNKFVEMLRAMVDPDADEGQQGQTGDQPPPFKGMPKPGGGLVGDAARSFDAEFPGVRRLAASDDHYGVPCPMRPKGSVHQQRLALDARERADGASGYLGGDKELDESVRRIGRCY